FRHCAGLLPLTMSEAGVVELAALALGVPVGAGWLAGAPVVGFPWAPAAASAAGCCTVTRSVSIADLLRADATGKEVVDAVLGRGKPGNEVGFEGACEVRDVLDGFAKMFS